LSGVGQAAAHVAARAAAARSEERTISLSDPIITLTLVTVVLWLAVIGWKLQRKEKERANGTGRGGRRDRYRDDYDDGFEDGFGDRYEGGYDDRYDPDDADYRPRRADNTKRLVEKAPKARKAPSQTSAVKAEVEINPGKCARFAFCEHEAPDIFQLKGDRIDYKTTVPPDRIEAVAMAVKVCPARAIKMKTPGTKPYLPQPDVDDAGRRPVRR
jgi:ferredoxin